MQICTRFFLCFSQVRKSVILCLFICFCTFCFLECTVFVFTTSCFAPICSQFAYSCVPKRERMRFCFFIEFSCVSLCACISLCLKFVFVLLLLVCTSQAFAQACDVRTGVTFSGSPAREKGEPHFRSRLFCAPPSCSLHGVCALLLSARYTGVVGRPSAELPRSLPPTALAHSPFVSESINVDSHQIFHHP